MPPVKKKKSGSGTKRQRGSLPVVDVEDGSSAAPACNTLPVVLARQIEWVNGMPKVVDRHVPFIASDRYADLAVTAMNLPYRGRIDPTDPERIRRIIEPEFEGLTNIEVAFIRQAMDAAEGDRTAFNDYQDRVIGKPKMRIASVTANVTYEDWLRQEAGEEMGDDEPQRHVRVDVRVQRPEERKVVLEDPELQ